MTITHKTYIQAPLNWKIIPAYAGTHQPKVKWTDYRTKEITASDIDYWFPDGYKDNIEVITGIPSAVIILDVDEKGDKSGSSELKRLGLYDSIQDTLICKTANDGRHYYFKYPLHLNFPIDTKNIGIQGVEVFGDGYKAELPPSTLKRIDGTIGHYEWKQDVSSVWDIVHLIKPIPQWLIDLCRDTHQRKCNIPPNPATDVARGDSETIVVNENSIAYAKVSLQREAKALSDIDYGGRNDALNIAACKLGNFVASELLTEDEVKEALYEACQTNGLIDDDGEHSFENTFNSGFNYGLGEPRGPSVIVEPKSKGSRRLIATPLSSIKSKPIEWLWEGVLAKGKYSLFAGDGAIGKSTASLSLAAIVSSGGYWPVTKAKAEVGSVLIITGEDGAADSIKPKLEVLNADTSKIIHIEAVIDNDKEFIFDLGRDIQELENLVAELGDVRLIIIDPINGEFIGKADGNNNSEVRSVLIPLTALAEKYDFAILGLIHDNKMQGAKSSDKVMGSKAWVNVARSVFRFSKEPTEENKRNVACIKNNIGPSKTYSFSIKEAETNDGIKAAKCIWDDTSQDLNADDLIIDADITGGAMKSATQFLRERLLHGSVSSVDLIKEAEEQGIAKRTLDRAKEKLGILSKFDGSKWSWSLATPTP